MPTYYYYSSLDATKRAHLEAHSTNAGVVTDTGDISTATEAVTDSGNAGACAECATHGTAVSLADAQTHSRNLNNGG